MSTSLSTGKISIVKGKTGFPLVRFEGMDFYISWLPVTKYEFEQYLWQASVHYGNSWYRTLLELNPRISWRKTFDADSLRYLFITGLLPEEISMYIRCLGDGYKLASYKKWMMFYNICKSSDDDVRQVMKDLRKSVSRFDDPAHAVFIQYLEIIHSGSLLEIFSLHRGIHEYVEYTPTEITKREIYPAGYGIVGSPRPKWRSIVWTPEEHPPLGFDGKTRDSLTGFRIVRTIRRKGVR